jgi:hypothetical protein
MMAEKKSRFSCNNNYDRVPTTIHSTVHGGVILDYDIKKFPKFPKKINFILKKISTFWFHDFFAIQIHRLK